jgi:hypothetical protein
MLSLLGREKLGKGLTDPQVLIDQINYLARRSHAGFAGCMGRVKLKVVPAPSFAFAHNRPP